MSKGSNVLAIVLMVAVVILMFLTTYIYVYNKDTVNGPDIMENDNSKLEAEVIFNSYILSVNSGLNNYFLENNTTTTDVSLLDFYNANASRVSNFSFTVTNNQIENANAKVNSYICNYNILTNVSCTLES